MSGGRTDMQTERHFKPTIRCGRDIYLELFPRDGRQANSRNSSQSAAIALPRPDVARGKKTRLDAE